MFAPPPPLERLQNGRMARNVRRSETVAISASAASAKVGVIAAALVGPILSRIEGILSRVISVPLVVLWVVRPAEAGTQPKIRQFDVAVSVDQNVVRFNISVDEAHFVDALNGTDQFRYVKPFKTKNQFSFIRPSHFTPRQLNLRIFPYLARGSSKMPSLIRRDIKSPPGM